MLVLSRKVGEKIIIGGGIELVVLSIGRGVIRLGVDCAQTIPVHRGEVWEKIESDKEQRKQQQQTGEDE